MQLGGGIADAGRRGRMIGRVQLTPSQRIPTFTCGSMRVRMLTPADPASIAPVWQEVEQRVGTGSLANSWAWTETWLRHYGDLVPHRFVVGDRGNPCAIALVTEGVGQYRGPFPIRTVHLGTSGEPDGETVRVEYNRLLVAPRDRGAFSQGILHAIGDSDLHWDELRLDGFPAEEVDPLIALDLNFVPDERVCHVADLRAIRQSGGTVLGALSSNTASKIRRSIRRLEEEHGPIRVEWAETREQAESIFEKMMALHAARWEAAGQTGTFASPRFAGFHRDVVARLFAGGGILLARVIAGDCTIGCDYSFVEHNRVLGYQWGLKQFEDRRLSPGIVTGAVVMQAALERGLDEYDWLAGDVLYKRQLATTTRQLVWASAARGARIHFIYELAKANRLAKRLRPLRSIAGLIITP